LAIKKLFFRNLWFDNDKMSKDIKYILKSLFWTAFDLQSA